MERRFIILQVIDPHYHQDAAKKNMREAVQLVETFGGEVIEKIIQHRVHPDRNTYIGTGKVAELKQQVKDQKIDVVVINEVGNAGQLFRLEKELWDVHTAIQVWDRVDLILNIFEQHASTVQAKLQIELARVQHQGPRARGLGKDRLSRQGGGIGTRGKGETNIEFEKRVAKKLEQKIKKQLQQQSKVLDSRLAERRKKGIKSIALVGYTSAGKSTLFNALTGKEKETNQALFTTLDSVVGKMKLVKYAPTVLVSDTIGFIDDLPPFLVEAFRSTLQESLAADLLLHVVDSADPEMAAKIDTVEQILTDLGVSTPPTLVFNKIDKITEEQLQDLESQYAHKGALFVSAKTKQGLEELKELASDLFLQADEARGIYYTKVL